MDQRYPSSQQIQNLVQLSTALGVVKKDNERFAPLKLTYFPFSTSAETYQRIQAITSVWQKLLFKASRDAKLIQRVYQQIQSSDPMVSNLMRIFRYKKTHDDDALTFIRTDYFLDQTNLPKIIEYNLFAVSMGGHSQNFQQAKRLSDPANKNRYVDNKPNSFFIDSVVKLYSRKKLKGIFLFVAGQKETNIFEHRLIEVKLLQAGINVVRITLIEADSKLHLDESGGLFYGIEEVSVVYYRTGYSPSDYQQDIQATWHAREIIEVSRAHKIPNVTFDLMNQKRMQVQLSKESVYSQFLSEEEGRLLKESLVPVWEFDHISPSQCNTLLETLERQGGEYVLKPNLEGGGNNIYGEEALVKLKSLDVEERKKYILMAKIVTTSKQNLLICGQSCIKTQCIYEISQYGTINVEEGSLLSSETCGFLIRTKPECCNEGGIMAGVGSICSWILE